MERLEQQISTIFNWLDFILPLEHDRQLHPPRGRPEVGGHQVRAAQELWIIFSFKARYRWTEDIDDESLRTIKLNNFIIVSIDLSLP